jgi:uncharacterized caspase-like protein
MRRFGRVALALVFLMLAAAPAALAEKRIALLIGNQSYTTEIGRLSNPHNDIALLESVLKRLGFDVTIVRDVGLAGLHQAINSYARRVRQAGPDTVGFFYYSGHGAADGTTNYLIPVDVKTIDDDQLWDQSLRLTEITRKLKDEAGNATHFVVFDACRNTLKLRKTGTKAIVQSKGFVPVSQESGMLVAYATAEGALASDVGTGAGPYARVLADEVVKPGIEAVAMFRNVQRRVRTAIGQEPYLGFNALGDIYFAGQAPPSGGSTITDAAREWAQVDKTSIAELQRFARRHSASPEADYARWRIDSLNQQVTTTPPVKVYPPPTAKEHSAQDIEDSKSLTCMRQRNRGDCERAGCSWLTDRGCVTPEDVAALIAPFVPKAPAFIPESKPAVGAPPAPPTVHTHFKCTMKNGVMSGNVFSFSLNALDEGGTGTLVEYGVPVRVYQSDNRQIMLWAKFRFPGLPEHGGVNFVFNKRTLAVEANLFRSQTLQELSECVKKNGNPLCQLDDIVESSSGTCEAR